MNYISTFLVSETMGQQLLCEGERRYSWLELNLTATKIDLGVEQSEGKRTPNLGLDLQEWIYGKDKYETEAEQIIENYFG